MAEPLLEVKDLTVDFRTDDGTVQAVRGVDFTVEAGKVLAIVGESGSGKSVTAQAMMGILPHNGHITGGEILLSDPKGADAPVDTSSVVNWR